MKQEFLNLGPQPIANGFLTSAQAKGEGGFKEYFFRLAAGFDPDTCLVSLMDFVDKPILFNDNYPYHTSGSVTMCDHFNTIANHLKNNYKYKMILEIGSNDGAFLKNFDISWAIAVEPCGNFAKYTESLGYPTYNAFWDSDTASAILHEYGSVDVVYSANCMCHIPDIDSAFEAVQQVLAPDGLFIFEDPSLVNMINRNSYDQIYDEHAHMFSVIALDKLLTRHGLKILYVDNLTVHGGSNRIWAGKIGGTRRVSDTVSAAIFAECAAGLDKFETYVAFSKRVNDSCVDLLQLLLQLRSQSDTIIGYGATSKSTVVYNYCGINSDIIDYITDTTPAKQGMVMPGVHIPIIPPNNMDGVDVAFLGAWNFQDEIVKKEQLFVDRGGKFITHVPSVRLL